MTNLGTLTDGRLLTQHRVPKGFQLYRFARCKLNLLTGAGGRNTSTTNILQIYHDVVLAWTIYVEAEPSFLVGMNGLHCSTTTVVRKHLYMYVFQTIILAITLAILVFVAIDIAVYCTRI